MVTATTNQKLWRVEFEIEHSDTARSSVVCFLYAVESGIRIYYSHHQLHSRQANKGAWEADRIIRQPLNRTLRATIESSVFQEVWDFSRSGEVRNFPAEPDTMIEEVNFEV